MWTSNFPSSAAFSKQLNYKKIHINAKHKLKPLHGDIVCAIGALLLFYAGVFTLTKKQLCSARKQIPRVIVVAQSANDCGNS